MPAAIVLGRMCVAGKLSRAENSRGWEGNVKMIWRKSCCTERR